jgi:hypothetical protein
MNNPACDADDQMLQMLVRFARGDIDTPTFEKWLYKFENLEKFLGVDIYLELISADFRDPFAVSDVKELIWNFYDAEISVSCGCNRLGDLSFIGMGEEEAIFLTLERQKDFGDDRWWLSLFECRECNQTWLVACEQRIYDVYFLRRLNKVDSIRIVSEEYWPDYFKSYSDLLRQAVEFGCCVRYFDPLNSLEIYWTIVDIALAKPGVAISELSELLPIDIEMTRAIAKRAIAEPGVVIGFHH